MLPHSKSTATKAVSALIAIAMIVSVVTIGGVAQMDSEDSDTSGGNAEPNDSIENATRIQYGQEMDANLSSPSDVDYYAINASAGDAIVPRLHPENRLKGAIAIDLVTRNGEVRTELTNDLASGPQNTPCQIPSADGYTGNVMEFNGTYYLRVRTASNFFCRTFEPNESATYDYTLAVNRTSLDEHEPNENGTTATTLELDETANATFAGYDSDVYAVNLTAEQNYTVTLESTDGFLGAIWVYGKESQPVDDPFWPHTEDNSSPYIFDPNGSTVAAVDSTLGRTTSVSFTPGESKTHYVQIVQNEYNGNLLDQSPYELTVNRTAGSPSDDDRTGESESPGGEDADSDGLTDAKEETFGTDPRNADTDDDGLPDGREVTEFGTDPLSEETDEDSLTDECELRNDLDPTNPDTDDDGTLDGEEV